MTVGEPIEGIAIDVFTHTLAVDAVARSKGTGEFLNDVSLESAGGVESGGGEGGHKHSHESNGEGGRNAEGSQEVGGSLDEGSNFGAESGCGTPGGILGLVGVCTGQERIASYCSQSESRYTSEDDEDCEESLGEHGAVADELGVGFAFDLFGGRSR